MAGITIIYDGDCPFCANYTALLRLRKAAGPVQLIDARSDAPLAVAARARGIDFDASMLVIWQGRDYQGGDAVNLLSTLAESGGPLSVRLVHWLTKTPERARAFYPWLRAGRNFGLWLKGKSSFKTAFADAPKAYRERAEVIGCFVDHELRIIMAPDAGMGGALWDVPTRLVPFGSRLPNSKLWVTWRRDWRPGVPDAPSPVVLIEPRDEPDSSSQI